MGEPTLEERVERIEMVLRSLLVYNVGDIGEAWATQLLNHLGETHEGA